MDVNRLVQSAIERHSVSGVLALLGEAVPCARVSTLTEIHDDEELRRRGMVREVTFEGKRLRVALPPLLHWYSKRGVKKLPTLGGH